MSGQQGQQRDGRVMPWVVGVIVFALVFHEPLGYFLVQIGNWLSTG